MAGICLIRLEEIRPAWLPHFCGLTSENAAHRVAVVWEGADGEEREGVFIPRRDTSSRLNHFAGGRLFPGEHHLAKFEVADDGQHVALSAQAADGDMEIKVRGHEIDEWPSSCFASLGESSSFFAGGSLGYSVTRDCCRYDGIRLQTDGWQVRPFAVEHVRSSFFADAAVFPAGSVTFDHGLVMRNLRHRWIGADDMLAGQQSEDVQQPVDIQSSARRGCATKEKSEPLRG